MEAKDGRNAQAVYHATMVNTASREQLLLITYDIGIKACRSAEHAMAVDDAETANTSLQKAEDVIRELMITLNKDAGGEVAEGLMKLYDFMYLLLVEANVKKTADNVTIVREMLEELKETWEEAIIKLAEEHPNRTIHPAVSSGQIENKNAIPAGGLNIAG